jgi:hypothetical protein
MESGMDQVGYLVEARSIPGYSGSPVFVRPESDRPGGIHLLNRRFGPWLLGVDCGHTRDWEAVYRQDSSKPEKTADLFVRVSTGYMIVIPAGKLAEMFFYPHFVEQRRKEWEQFKNPPQGIE